MKSFKCLTAVVLCFALLLCFSACGEKQADTQSEKTQKTEYTEKWVVEPSIVADNIYSLPLCTFNEETNHYDVNYGDVYVIEKDGKLGFINSNGEIVVEPKYNTVETCICTDGYIATIKPEGSYRSTYKIDSSFNELWMYPHSCEEFEGYTYLWNAGLNTVSVQNGDVQADGGAYLPEAVGLDSGKYAVVSAGKIQGETDYDAAGVFTGGVVAMSKGSKWGYVNALGETVIPFSYDAVPDYSATGNGNTPYECSENYITVLKDGKYGIFKADGTQVVPCNYRSLTTVHDGRAFVSNDGGVWGILLIDETVSNGIVYQTEVVQSSTQPTEEATSQEVSSSQTNE